MSSREKQRLLLAVGERQLENFIKSRMSDNFNFTKEASYREIVIKRIREERPDVVLIREALKGSMSMDSLILDIRENYPDVRVVFYTSKNRPGEPLLKTLVSYGVYDLIGGETITETQIFNGLLKPKQLSDVRQYLDAPTIQGDEPPMLVKSEYVIEKETKPEEQIEFPPLNNTGMDEQSKKEDKKEGGFFGRLFGKKKKEGDEHETNNQQALEFMPEEEAPSIPVKETFNPPVSNEDTKEYTNPLELFGSDNSGPVKQSFNDIAEEANPSVSEEDNGISFEDIDIPDIEFDSDWTAEETNNEPTVNVKPEIEDVPPVKETTGVPDNYHERAKPDERMVLQARDKPRQPSDNVQITRERERAHVRAPVQKESPRKSSKSRGWLTSKSSNGIQVESNQIITFISAVNGVGNTHIAFNTALRLADEGNKILYIDMNSSFSSVDFSFQLGTWQQGIDKALADIEYNSGMNASNNIIRMKEVKRERKEDKQLQELYKSLPDTLDYLFYSLDYQTLEQQHPVPKDRLRDLIMYLMTRERYDAVIIDSEPLGRTGVDGLLNLSNKIYFTMTQDPGQMGVFHRQFDAAKKRVDITDERYIIVNQFVNVEPKVKRIQKWTNEEVLQTIPFTHKSVILANFLGEPFILKTKHKDAIEAFDALARHLAQ